MKRLVAFFLVMSICLSLCGCNTGEKQNTIDNNHVEPVPDTTELNNDNVIAFEPPIVVAEDEYVRVELLKFYQDYYLYGGAGSAVKADPSWEGATLEKFMVLKFYNKCDHELSISITDIYLGNDGASYYLLDANVSPDAGKNITRTYMVRTGEKEAVKSMEELYSCEGEFFITHEYEDGTKKNPHTLKFSIPNALGKGYEDSQMYNHSEAWRQFHEYLQMRGPVTVITKKTKTGHNQVTIEATADTIHIIQEGENTAVSGKATAHAENSLCFDLSANVKCVNVRIKYQVEGSDEHGYKEQSSNPEFSWDIQSYRSGDPIVLTVDYKYVDEKGNSLKEDGSKLQLALTQALIEVTDVLHQTLEESGLDITMADMGFISYTR